MPRPINPGEISPANFHAPERDADVLASAPSRGGLSLTSSSFRLATPLFNLDLTWRRVSVPDRGPQPAPSTRRPQGPLAAAGSTKPPAPDFQEILRRQQVAQLLFEPPAPPPEGLHLDTPQSRNLTGRDTGLAAYRRCAEGATDPPHPQDFLA